MTTKAFPELGSKTYPMDDGTIVKTSNAVQWWDEATRFDGNCTVSVATGTEWEHQKLYKSRKGRYWLEHTSLRQGSKDYAEWIGDRTAVQWLIANYHELPEDLKPLEAEIEE